MPNPLAVPALCGSPDRSHSRGDYPRSLEPRDSPRAMNCPVMEFPISVSHVADGPAEPSHYLRK